MPWSKSAVTRELLLNSIQQALTLEEIAEQIGVTKARVWQVLKREGLFTAYKIARRERRELKQRTHIESLRRHCRYCNKLLPDNRRTRLYCFDPETGASECKRSHILGKMRMRANKRYQNDPKYKEYLRDHRKKTRDTTQSAENSV